MLHFRLGHRIGRASSLYPFCELQTPLIFSWYLPITRLARTVGGGCVSGLSRVCARAGAHVSDTRHAYEENRCAGARSTRFPRAMPPLPRACSAPPPEINNANATRTRTHKKTHPHTHENTLPVRLFLFERNSVVFYVL